MAGRANVRLCSPAVHGLALALVLCSTNACAFRNVVGSSPLARTAYEQTYLPASHNWEFRSRYSEADRLFNAFDYGHAILYETLLTHPTDGARRLDGPELDFVLHRVLRHPPNVQLEEHAIGPTYTSLVPELAAMFEWAHMLHRQIYDVWADEWTGPAQKDAQIQRLLRYYRSRPDLAFSSQPKSMMLMEGQSYSLGFRRASPKFNGLLWSYHWLQMTLYDALMVGRDNVERRANVDATIARFWTMLDSAPSRMPSVMPMSAAIAPAFSTRYPEAAIIFDNLHSLHDVVGDILISTAIPRSAKRRALLEVAARFRDDTTAITTRAEWLEMSHSMGVDRMGGLALPNVPR